MQVSLAIAYIGALHKGYFMTIRRPGRGVAVTTIGICQVVLLSSRAIHDPEASREEWRAAIGETLVGNGFAVRRPCEECWNRLCSCSIEEVGDATTIAVHKPAVAAHAEAR